MTTHRRYIFLLLMFLTCSIAKSQQSIDSVVNYQKELFSAMPTELIYIQPSKEIYEVGEDLWFKSYQLDAHSFGFSNNSKTLYLQMINSKDSVVWKEKYLIENSIVSGHIYVDKKLVEGNYRIEGYTRCSFYRNDTITMLPGRRIKIVKNIAGSKLPVLSKESTFRFQTFPEGGNLVCGILSKLAFKATDGKGNPLDVEGLLYQDDEPLSEIKGTHNGMGTAFFTPLPGKKYLIKLKNGNSYPLPKIHSEGMVMWLSKQENEQLDFIISQSSELPPQSIYLIGQMRGMVCCIAKGTLKDNLKIVIPLNNFLYQGIVEFTLFNEALQPIAERLVYVHPEKKLNITFEPDKKSYGIREKVTVKIKVTDENNKPVRANLGISVYDQSYSYSTAPVNIISYCYLTSQIRGEIYNPTYYFDQENEDRKVALDLLLLTQGWRRYIWNITHSTYHGQEFLTDEINGVQIIESKKGKEKSSGSTQLIQVSGAEGNSTFVWADSIGQFSVGLDEMKELRGGYVYLKPMLSKEFKPKLLIDDLFPTINTVRSEKTKNDSIIDLLQIEKTIIQPIASQDSVIILDEVTVTGRGRKTFRDKFMGRLDSLAQKKLGAWVCAHGWLENYMDGYTHHHDPRYCPIPSDNGEPRSAPVIGKSYSVMKAEYYFSNNKLYFRPIDRKKVVYRGEIYSEEELLRQNSLWRTKGYYATREFYCPDEVDMSSSIPDARNTLFWSPSVTTDENGEATFSFYCSDTNTSFIGLVEGVDGVGSLGTTKYDFRVMRNVTP